MPTPGSVAKSSGNAVTGTGGDTTVFDRLSAAKSKQPAPNLSSPESHTKPALVPGSIYNSTGKFNRGYVSTTGKKKRIDKERERVEPVQAAPLTPVALNDGQKKQAVGLLKLKMAYAMRIMDQNLGLLKRLEGEEENSSSNVDEEASSLTGEAAVAEMMKLSADEVNMCRHFEDRINTLLLAPGHVAALTEDEFASV
tara:strand:- start:145 stop:735 length:591 start_codon:yes stop_codon:yes gene_type:complete